MKLFKNYILAFIILILAAIYIVCQVLEYEVVANTARSLILPLATILYVLKIKKKSFYFMSFLIVFSISEFLGLWIYILDQDTIFYIGNFLNILGYILLILDVVEHIKSSSDYKVFLLKHTLHIATLSMLCIYLVYLLGGIMRPYLNMTEYTVAMVYSSVILVLLGLSLINFICNDTKHSLILFLGSMCIVFSEFVQIAYYYLLPTFTLSIVYSILLLAAFFFFYKQGFLKQDSYKNKSLNLFRNHDFPVK